MNAPPTVGWAGEIHHDEERRVDEGARQDRAENDLVIAHDQDIVGQRGLLATPCGHGKV